MSAVVPVCCLEVRGGLSARRGLEVRVLRIGQRGGGQRGGHGPAADDVDGGVHARHDPGVAELGGTCHQLLEPLGHGVRERQGRQVEGVGVPAGEAAVVGRGRAALPQQLRGDDDVGVVHGVAERVDLARVDDLAVLASCATDAGTGRRTWPGLPEANGPRTVSTSLATVPSSES